MRSKLAALPAEKAGSGGTEPVPLTVLFSGLDPRFMHNPG